MGKIHFSQKDLAYAQLYNTKEVDRLYTRLDSSQHQFLHAIESHKVVFVDAPAGTGKTTIATMAALDGIRRQLYSCIMYVRFPSWRGERLGSTPGTLEEKEGKYMYPFFEAMNECGVQDEAVWQLVQSCMIKLLTDVTMRGVNIRKSFVIIDEAQNAEDVEQLKLVLTRIHDDCKTVVIGHSGQVDSRVKKYGNDGSLNAFQVYALHMSKKPWACIHALERNYRGAVAQWADKVEESLP